MTGRWWRGKEIEIDLPPPEKDVNLILYREFDDYKILIL
jgi:hypothetical protein